jgi:1-acyl-sn-glycerol-3-phosphate acyltransferase
MVLFKVFYRFSARGRENLTDGPTILVANHTSYLDPVAVALAAPWPIYFVAKEELFEIPVLGWYIKRLHAFPVKRGRADRNVLKTALAHLKRGRTVLIFPEGTRNREDGLSDGLPGAAFLAYKGGARIVPTAIYGAGEVMPAGSKRLRFPKIGVRFGEPIVMDGEAGDKKEVVGRTTERLMREINSMLEEVRA